MPRGRGAERRGLSAPSLAAARIAAAIDHPPAVTRPLPDPAEPEPPLRVLYDENCPFCRWTADRLRRWDRRARLRLVPYDRVREDPELTAAVRGERLGEAVHVVDRDDRVATGGEAVLAVVALLPGGDPIVRLIRAIPPARVAVRLGYALLNRWRGPLAATLRLDGPRRNELHVD